MPVISCVHVSDDLKGKIEVTEGPQFLRQAWRSQSSPKEELLHGVAGVAQEEQSLEIPVVSFFGNSYRQSEWR